MSWFEDLIERTELASVASFLVTLAGLYLSYVGEKWEIFGAIIGGSLTWLYYRKPSDNGDA